MARQGYAGGVFRLSLAVCGRRVEVVDAIFQGLVDQTVDGLLVYLALLAGALVILFVGSAHAAVA